MFEQSLGLRENPFVAGHQPRFVYPSREHQEALAHLRFGIENREPFVLITGEVGTGKTTAIYDALSGWGTRAVVALITNSALTRAELIEEIALRFGLALTPGMTKPQALVLLERHLRAVMARQELAILLLDEAQNLERELLEEIRLLSNLEQDGQKLLQIFLVGQPELEAKLAQPELRQLRQRIAVHYRLKPMTADETMHYLHHRIAVAGGNAHQLFPAETCHEVYRLTHGIPREINTVASQALLNAYVDDSRVVRPQHVSAVARDTEFKSVLDVHGPKPAVAAAAAPSLAPPPDFEAAPPMVLPAAAPPPAAVIPAAAPAPPPAPEPEVISESFEAVEPFAPPVTEPAAQVPHEAPPAIAAATPVEHMPTLEEMEAIMAEATAPLDQDIAREELIPAIEAEAELEAEAEPGPEVLPAAPAPAGADITMPDWLEAAIAKHTPSVAAPAPAPAPAARPAPEPEPMIAAARIEVPTSSPIPAFLAPSASGEPEPEVITAARPSLAERFAREPVASEPTEPPRGARILPMPQLSTSAEPDFLPSRLREKLEEEAEAPRRRANIAWVAAAIFAVAAVVTIALAFRFGVFGGKDSGGPATAVPAVAGKTEPKPAAPVAKSTPAPVKPAPAAAESSAARPAPAPATTAPTASRGEGATVPSSGVPVSGLGLPSSSEPTPSSPPAPTGRRIYGIAVGTYFDRERALQEAERVAASLNLAARYMPVAEDGTTMFRAVVGRFQDRAEAERIAGALTGRGLANEGRVVLIGTLP